MRNEQLRSYLWQSVRVLLAKYPQLKREIAELNVRDMFKGGEGSGNFGHAGRPGEVGGSAPGDGGGSVSDKIPAKDSAGISGVVYSSENGAEKNGGIVTGHLLPGENGATIVVYKNSKDPDKTVAHEVGHNVYNQVLDVYDQDPYWDAVNELGDAREYYAKDGKYVSTWAYAVGTTHETFAEMYMAYRTGGEDALKDMTRGMPRLRTAFLTIIKEREKTP